MSFYTSLTGLNAASKELSVTANNIANSSTTGFKKSNVSFGDIFAQSPQQHKNSAVGLGTSVKSIDQQFTQGFLQSSSNALDLAISGEGFFKLKGSDGTDIFTRNGNFMVDGQNRVVNSSGYALQAFPVDSTGKADMNRVASDLTVPPMTSGLATATTQIDLAVNLPAGGTPPAAFNHSDPSTWNESTTMSVFDSNGNERSLSLYYRLDSTAPSAYEVHAYLDGQVASGTASVNPGTLTFDGTGAFVSSTLDLTDSLGGTLAINLDNSTESGSAFVLKNQTVDGSGEGALVGIDVNEQGLVSASYSNGAQLSLGKVAIANFDMPSGLRQLGDSNFAATNESGTPRLDEPGLAGFGTIRSGSLEGSNVDLTEELVAMINTQRKFQANAKAIETNSTLAQTIINLRG